MHNTFSAFLQTCQQRVNSALDNILPKSDELPSNLHEAMRYAVLNGGKRLRPTLVYAAGELIAPASAYLDNIACAVELIHCYSLVHDDLPAMDNDSLRRGKPTCHVVYGEAMAILVGDALQALAFSCLGQVPVNLVGILAQASGSYGMVGGQAIDITHVGKKLDAATLARMHDGKTGALIHAAIRMGAQANPSITEKHLSSLDVYAQHLGLAFQVHDDILDATSTTQTLGKTAGSDEIHEKPTYVSLLGIEGAKTQAFHLYENALKALENLPFPTTRLREIAQYAITREL